MDFFFNIYSVETVMLSVHRFTWLCRHFVRVANALWTNTVIFFIWHFLLVIHRLWLWASWALHWIFLFNGLVAFVTHFKYAKKLILIILFLCFLPDQLFWCFRCWYYEKQWITILFAFSLLRRILYSTDLLPLFSMMSNSLKPCSVFLFVFVFLS